MEVLLKASLALLLVLLSAHSLASTGRAFGLLNTAMTFIDNGRSDDSTSRIESEMEGEGYGVGADYKINSPLDKVIFRGGFIYEFERSAEQVTVVSDIGSDSSRNDLPKIQMTTVYGNAHLLISENIALVGGLGYYLPKVDGKGSFSKYDIKAGAGYQFGLDFKLHDNFFVQIIKRRIVLDSKGVTYKGKADLSNLALLVGKEF